MLAIDFSFRELVIFCKVVELESFSRAAEAVFLVQASVSERIKKFKCKPVIPKTMARRTGAGCSGRAPVGPAQGRLSARAAENTIHPAGRRLWNPEDPGGLSA